MKMKKINEIGRSMVEMLGVLAIIGVLSVGAIAGYSKAMMKYKLNKQAQQLSHLLNITHIYKKHWYDVGKNGDFVQLMPYYIRMGEIPKEMIKDDPDYIYDAFNSAISIRTNGCFPPNACQGINLFIDITNKNSFELCQNMFNIAKEFDEHIHYANVYLNNSGESYMLHGKNTFGCKNDKSKCLKNATLEQIHEACVYCNNEANKTKKCTFSVAFVF